jgi:hypothetical protein
MGRVVGGGLGDSAGPITPALEHLGLASAWSTRYTAWTYFSL